MSDFPEHPLYAAAKRLTLALDRLENNLQSLSVARDRDVQQEQQVVFFERENAVLLQERESLSSTIADLQHRYNDLHKVASSIHGKLDDSILRLTEILENA